MKKLNAAMEKLQVKLNEYETEKMLRLRKLQEEEEKRLKMERAKKYMQETQGGLDLKPNDPGLVGYVKPKKRKKRKQQV